MSDDYFREGRFAGLAYWGLGQMMKGAGMAAIFVFSVGLILWAIYGVSLLLPDESKQAPDPNTWSNLFVIEKTVQV
ncbi:RC-LH1 core complex protein PufX [Tabrizicola caldifontis]|nr:RC-LH1 core complex protein PufX [Rhodobacter sp. YIM 73028]